MARDLNKVMIIGHLGRDPEMRFTANGRPVAAFNVATTRCWIDNDGVRQEDTEWFHIVTWGGLAELCKKRLRKGSRVYVEGRIQTRCWEGPDGGRHFRTEVLAQELIFLNESDNNDQNINHDTEPNVDDDDLDSESLY